LPKKKTKKEARKVLLKLTALKFIVANKNSLEKPITLEELEIATKKITKGKAPGTDGLGIELYQKCPFLLEGLLDMWNYSLCEGKLSKLAKMGLLKILFKKGDKELITNYCSLTLGNSDYKIIAKVLAMWLSLIIHKVVSKNQTGFIPKRDIRNNIIEAHYVLRHFVRDKINEALGLLDFEKAYNRADHEYLFKVMKCMNCGAQFILFITIIHTDSTIIIQINLILSEEIKVESGVWQGCPVAPLLFGLATQPFNNLLSTNSYFQGIVINGQNVNTSLYADDTTLYLYDVYHIENAISAIKIYEEASAAQLNIEKCSLILTQKNNLKLPYKRGCFCFCLMGLFYKNKKSVTTVTDCTRLEKIININTNIS